MNTGKNYGIKDCLIRGLLNDYMNITLKIGSLFYFYRAPQGCMQYFFENVNTITSYNYDGNIGRAGTEGGVLANQDYRICIRQNPGIFCVKIKSS